MYRGVSFCLQEELGLRTEVESVRKNKVKVVLRITAIWERAQKTGSIATLNVNANSWAKERARKYRPVGH